MPLPFRSARPASLTALLLLLLTFAACGDAPPADQGTDAATTAASPAWVDEAVIYEVFVPDFSEEGTFQGVIGRLDALQELGVTTLWFMPIHPIGEEGRKGPLGSPYAIRDFYAVNPEYGTADDFRALVDSVHARGMHVIIDFVANHTAPDNAWLEEHPDWYVRDEAGEPVVPEGTDWTDVRELNYDNEALRAEMRQVMRYWVEEFGIDGYRCDVAELVPLSFWEEAITELRTVAPVMMLAEGADPELHRVGFDLSYAWPAYAAMKEVWEGEPASALVEVVREVEAELPEGAGRMRFITNHDETAWDAPPPALFGGQQGAQAAFVLAASLPGVPLVYNGQELGVTEPVPFFEATPYDWTIRPEVRAFYRRFLEHYHASPALRTGTLEVLAPETEDAVLFRRAAEDESLLVAVNVRDREVTVPLPDGLAGDYTDLMADASVTLGESLTLDPYAYHVLRAE